MPKLPEQKDLESESGNRPCPEIMTAREAAAYLRTTTVNLWRLRRDQDLPVHHLGRSLRFRKNEIDEWLDAQRARRDTET